MFDGKRSGFPEKCSFQQLNDHATMPACPQLFHVHQCSPFLPFFLSIFSLQFDHPFPPISLIFIHHGRNSAPCRGTSATSATTGGTAAETAAHEADR